MELEEGSKNSKEESEDEDLIELNDTMTLDQVQERI